MNLLSNRSAGGNFVHFGSNMSLHLSFHLYQNPAWNIRGMARRAMLLALAIAELASLEGLADSDAAAEDDAPAEAGKARSVESVTLMRPVVGACIGLSA